MLILTTFSPLCAALRQIKADAHAKNKIFGKQNSDFSWAYMLNESSFLVYDNISQKYILSWANSDLPCQKFKPLRKATLMVSPYLLTSSPLSGSCVATSNISTLNLSASSLMNLSKLLYSNEIYSFSSRDSITRSYYILVFPIWQLSLHKEVSGF